MIADIWLWFLNNQNDIEIKVRSGLIPGYATSYEYSPNVWVATIFPVDYVQRPTDVAR